jgi:hypothetical protein
MNGQPAERKKYYMNKNILKIACPSADLQIIGVLGHVTYIIRGKNGPIYAKIRRRAIFPP